MNYEVVVTDGALADLASLDQYLATHDSVAAADHVLGQLESVIAALARFPERGGYPAELVALGIRDFRQVFFKPYRVIYRVLAGRVYVVLVADGRRDLQTLLQRRTLR